MLNRIALLGSIALCGGVGDIQGLHAQASLPDLSGTYRCVPDTRPCRSPTFAVSQSGSKLEVKSEAGELGTGQVTSAVSVSLGAPWNELGIILTDGRTVEWAAGTRWQKQ